MRLARGRFHSGAALRVGKVFVSGFFAVAVSAGCGSVAPVDATRSAITNGMDDDGDPAVVGVRLVGGPVFCTGTLIAPRVVLTAGHCVSAASDSMLEVYFGNIPGTDGENIASVDARTHPFYDPVGLKNDLGLITLERDATAPPVLLSRRPFDDTFVGMPIKIVGFGSTGQSNGLMDQRKHIGEGRILDYEALKFRISPDPSQPCEGDSGGPGFMQLGGSSYELVGVTSSGDPACVMFGRDTRVDPFIDDFITPFLATSPGVAPVGTACGSSFECASNLCAHQPGDDKAPNECAARCQTNLSCVNHTSCQSLVGDGGVSACFEKEDGCSMTAGGRAPTRLLWICLAYLGIAFFRRARLEMSC